MILTKRQPVSTAEMITEDFMVPLGITQGQLASAMGVSRRTVNELCTGKRSITVDTALMLAKVFGNTPNFWLNLQQRNDLWTALHSSKRMQPMQNPSSWMKKAIKRHRNFLRSFSPIIKSPAADQ
jgi:addiction module HigA family antidote